MHYQKLVILLGYRKNKLEDTRLVEYEDISKHLRYMVEINDKMTSIEELRVQPNGTTIYWQTHRVSDLISNDTKDQLT
jgi:hypothetical protein